MSPMRGQNGAGRAGDPPAGRPHGSLLPGRDARRPVTQGPTGEHLPPTRHQPPVREGLIFSSTFQKLGKFDLAVRKFEVHSGPCDAFVSWCDGIEARSPRRITVTASLATRAGETLWCSPTQENSARAAGTQPSCRTGGAGGRAGPLGEGRQGRAAPRALGAAPLCLIFISRLELTLSVTLHQFQVHSGVSYIYVTHEVAPRVSLVPPDASRGYSGIDCVPCAARHSPAMVV